MKRREVVPVIGFVAVMLITGYVIKENSFFTLPILEHSRLFFQLLIAATVIAVLRNIVGISTFGVFGPMIVAIVLLQAGLMWGVFLFFNIFLVAYAARIIFDPFKLPGSHRVAIIISIVGIYMSLIEVVGESYHIKPLEFTIFFPILITSWIADRFVNEGKERGLYYPLTKLLWTTLAVIAAYLVMDYNPIIDFVLLNPETWTALILFNILLGTQTRFRLLEYHRFRRLNPKTGVLTMNTRNRGYIERYNPRELFPSSEKSLMREKLASAGVPVPSNLLVVSEKREIGAGIQLLQNLESFVVKPSRGYGGEGILIITGRNGGEYTTSDGRRMNLSQITGHITQILDGQYSNSPHDTALIERLILPGEFYAPLSPTGLPDIRVIVFEGFPVMAMIRAPTLLSKGKANLHLGAVAIAVKISTGQTFTALHDGRIVEKHPDSGFGLVGLQVPDWRSILEIACKAQETSGLGYVGVDVVVDKELGPIVLEVNKRPGLTIQVVNGKGLESRLRFIEERLPEVVGLSVQEKVALGMSWAAGEWMEAE